MKRLIFVALALILIVSSGIIFPQTVDAAKAPVIKSLDANSLVGMTTAALTKKYGKPARQEPSEYGLTWYVYNKDYKNFFMAGVRNGKVVAVYTNAKTQNYKNLIKLGTTKAAVRKKLGTPVTYIQSSGSVCMLSNTSQRDFFVVKKNYVIVFYDNIAGGKVTSLLIVPKADEDYALTTHPALSVGVVAAYQRISVDLINAIRVRSGLKKLTVDTKDTQLAVSRSKDMRNRNYFSHYTPSPKRVSPFQQAKSMGIRYTSMGENIAYGDQNAIFAHEAFMNSSGHRYNVLKAKYTKIGAGVAYGGSRYVLLTNIFTR